MTEPHPPHPPSPSSVGDGGNGGPWRAVAGALTLAYVVWYALDVTTLAVDPYRFNRVHAAADGPVPRLVFAVLALGVFAHAADGLPRALTELWPGLARWTPALRAATGFAAMAVWVPLALVIMWPAVREWVR